MASWQSALKNISGIMPYLLKTGTLSDITFLVGSGPNKMSFKLHKLLLAVRSDVFETMFFGALQEKGGSIGIIDVSPHIFEIMLKFIYEDTLGVKTMEEAMDTYAVAHKYNITELMLLSSNYIKGKLNHANASLVYQISSIYNDKEVKSACSEIISKHPKEVIQSETFTQISFKTVENMLEIISLNISNHFILFESLIKLAKTELERRKDDEPTKNLRQLMDPFLPKIKFLSMSFDEFTRGPAASGILTESETVKIFMNMSVPNFSVLPDWCNKEKTLKQVVQRLVLPHYKHQSGFSHVGGYRGRSGNYSSSSVDCEMVIKGKSILLNGFRIFNFANSSVHVSLKINNTHKALCASECSAPSNSGDETELLLREPFLLQQNVNYKVHVDVQTITTFNGALHDIDMPLPSGGSLRISNFASYSLPFSQLLYSECV